MKKVRNLLSGAASLGSGPVYKCNGSMRMYRLDERKLNEKNYEVLSGKPDYATTDYLGNCATEIELKMLQVVGSSVKNIMQYSSYAKDIGNEIDDGKQRISNLIIGKSTVPRGWDDAESVLKRDAELGVLSKYPILFMIKEQLTNDDLNFILDELGYHESRLNIEQVCWGAEATSIFIRGVLPYNDAASLCKRTSMGIIYVQKNLYM
jgi:hypothetical protein